MRQHDVPEDGGKKRGLTKRTSILIAVGVVLAVCLCGAVFAALQGGDDTETPEAAAATPEGMVAVRAEATDELAPIDTPVPTESPTDTPQPTDTEVPTPVAATKTPAPAAVPATETPAPTAVPATNTPAPTAEPATNTPAPTATQSVQVVVVPEGTYLVGTDIKPGIYVGQAGQGVFDSCYWARLSGLSGALDDVLANANAVGLYYLEVLPTDKALETACELRPIDQVPARETLLTVLQPGMYLVGRDIGPGMYRGTAGADVLASCYWARLSGVTGELDQVLANGNATGQYYIEVQPGDFALEVACEVEKVQ
jgi:hypothetical protein